MNVSWIVVFDDDCKGECEWALDDVDDELIVVNDNDVDGKVLSLVHVIGWYWFSDDCIGNLAVDVKLDLNTDWNDGNEGQSFTCDDSDEMVPDIEWLDVGWVEICLSNDEGNWNGLLFELLKLILDKVELKLNIMIYLIVICSIFSL